MNLFEKIKLRLRPQVKVYTHLYELSADLRAIGLSQWAKEIDDTLGAGMFTDEIIGEEAILLARILKEETLPKSLNWKIHRIRFEIGGIWNRTFAIAASEFVPAALAPSRQQAVAKPEVDYERAHKWVGGCHSDEDFKFVKCQTCGKFALMDDEIDTIYRSADDPRDACLYAITDPVKCPSCGASDSFEDTTGDDAEALLKSEWAEFLRIGTRLRFLIDDKSNSPAKIAYDGFCIRAAFTDLSHDRTWRLSADTFTCSVIPESGRLAGIDAYTPPACWIPIPELKMPDTTPIYRCHISADFDANGIAPLCKVLDKRVVWQHSGSNKVLRAVFEDRTEHFYAIAPNLVIGVCDTNILSEVLFGGIDAGTKEREENP